MNYGSRQKYKVLGRCKPENVLPYTGPSAVNKTFFNHSVKMTSLRYQTFSKSTRCACCGIEGTIMLLEMPTNGGHTTIPHFNLYAEYEGKLVLITKDHKQPKSKGGKNSINNMQTMCYICNELKGSSKRTVKDLHKIRDGSQTVYMVSDTPYVEDMLEGFATTQDGIAHIIKKHLDKKFDKKFEIRVDMQKMRVILKREDGFICTYYIHEYKRV